MSLQKTNICFNACFYSNAVFIQFNIHFSCITLAAKFHTVHVPLHSKYSSAKMANMIDLNSIRKLSYHSNFETRSLNVLEPMESIFCPMPSNPVNNEPSIFNEN